MPEPSFLPDKKTLLSFVIWNSLRTKSVGPNKVSWPDLLRIDV